MKFITTLMLLIVPVAVQAQTTGTPWQVSTNRQASKYYSLAHPEQPPTPSPASTNLTIIPVGDGIFYVDDRVFVNAPFSIPPSVIPLEIAAPAKPKKPFMTLNTNNILANWDIYGPMMYKSLYRDIARYQAEGNNYAATSCVAALGWLKSFDPTNTVSKAARK